MRTLGRCLGRGTFAWIVVSFLINALIPYPAWATPMVAITQPTNGATVAAEVWIDAVYQSSSNIPITKLELLIDDTMVHSYVLPTPRTQGQQSFSYKFEAEAGQLHKIVVKALDSTGATGEASIQVTVKRASVPPGDDRTPPLVNIYYPHDGQQVSGQCEIKIDARDNTGVEWVFVYLDGRMRAMIKGNPPYVDRWDTTRTDDGKYTLQARAWDAAENEGQSAPITVTVANRERTALQHTSDTRPLTITNAPAPGLAAPQPTQPREDIPLPTPAPIAAPAPSAQPTGAVAPPSPPTVQPAKLPAGPESAMVEVGVSAPLSTEGSRVATAGTVSQPIRAALLAPPTVGKVSTSASFAQAALPMGFGALSGGPRTDRPTTGGPAPTVPLEKIVAAPVPAHPAFSSVNASPITAKAHFWASMATGAEACAVVPSGGFASALNGKPTRVLVLTQQFIGEAAVAGLPSSEGRFTVDPLTGAPSPPPAAVAFRVGSPSASVRTMVLPAVQAAPPTASAVSSAVAPEARACPTAEGRQSLPKLPQVLGPNRATFPAVGVSAESVPDRSACTAALPGTRPAVRRGAAGPGQVALAPHTGEVYLLAMLPTASVSPNGTERSSRPEGRQAQAGHVVMFPSALARFDEVKVVYDGQLLPLRACPEVTKGISMGPIRELFEECDGVLYWFPVEKRVKAVSPHTKVELQIGVPVAQVNGQQTPLELAPYVKRGRTMVPLSFLAATLGLTISFDSQRGQLIITRNDM